MMQPISNTETGIIIPYETAIALYRLGRFDAALLANCLPSSIINRECPEILRDPEAIAFVGDLVDNE